MSNKLILSGKQIYTIYHSLIFHLSFPHLSSIIPSSFIYHSFILHPSSIILHLLSSNSRTVERRCHNREDTKKPLTLTSQRHSLFFCSSLSAYFALSAGAAALSAGAATVLSGVAVESTTSTAGSSTGASTFFSLQDAKEIAAKATNIKTNFFIFFAFLNL